MIFCASCGEEPKDVGYIKYQLKKGIVLIRDTDDRIWLRCRCCKKMGHASCIYSLNEKKFLRLESYSCCHSPALHSVMQKKNKRSLYGDKLSDSKEDYF